MAESESGSRAPVATTSAKFDTLPYVKMMLHAAKYPTSAVNGVFFGHMDGAGEVVVEDAVPLFHSPLNLSPMLEVALLQLDSHCQSLPSTQIVGYYQANETSDSNALDSTASAITSQLKKNNPGSIAVMIRNDKMNTEELANGAAMAVFFPSKSASDQWNVWTSKDTTTSVSTTILPAPSTAGASLVSLLKTNTHTRLMDFDDHLNDVTLDWLNVELNKTIREQRVSSSAGADSPTTTHRK
eukprot:m.182359 g.182359  ORF g.182359 m.182359 type:complete len:241 (+) comp18459_c0_seq5:79-801(+)